MRRRCQRRLHLRGRQSLQCKFELPDQRGNHRLLRFNSRLRIGSKQAAESIKRLMQEVKKRR